MAFALNSRSRWSGATLIAIGIFAIVTPHAAGRWTVGILGLILVGAGIGEIIRAFRTGTQSAAGVTYVGGMSMLAMGLLLLWNPSLVAGGLFLLAALVLAFDGIARITATFRSADPVGRYWLLAAGGFNVALAAFLAGQRGSLGVGTLGAAVGLYVISKGWTMLFVPGQGHAIATHAAEGNEHPDPASGLRPHPYFVEMSASALAREQARVAIDWFWIATLVVVFFAIHAGRMSASWTWLGMISPLVAVAGDVLSALLLSIMVLLPARLGWRRVTRPLERTAWQRRLGRSSSDPTPAPLERLADVWLDGRFRWALRMREARGSVTKATSRALQAGLPIVAVLIAVNPIWGFSWYFNTENWASGFWQKVTETRVDAWRETMLRAVSELVSGDSAPAIGMFDVQPEGVAGTRDFSFLVIGDPGEGDPSQHSLRDRYLELGRREDVKFLAISSDVIYPDGAMRDYEFNFYGPFKGFEKPVYAIPGNHDWFNALEAFVANFLEPAAARGAIAARRRMDFGTPASDGTVDDLIAKADQLRQRYRIRNGAQRAPFFRVRAPGFTLIAADTGILRSVDDTQFAWLERTLAEARGDFTMVVLGHPFYAGGHYHGQDNAFGRIHDLLRRYRVPLVMAGDTHDFEYYRERTPEGGAMHHFVNGGGGAYLSIGTALDWPAQPPVPDYAYYPRADAVRAKLEAETPRWKWPAWWWVKRLNAWPASVEALSAVFDFNRAPFFQSFVEVRVEGSVNRVRLIVHGVDGPLRWRDLALGGDAAADAGGNDTVEFILPMPDRDVIP